MVNPHWDLLRTAAASFKRVLRRHDGRLASTNWVLNHDLTEDPLSTDRGQEREELQFARSHRNSRGIAEGNHS